MSWLSIPSDSDFTLANIPFGVITTASSSTPRPATAIGDHVLDLNAFAENGGFQALNSASQCAQVFAAPTLNLFAAQGRSFHRAVREHLQNVFSQSTTVPELLRDNKQLQEKALLKREDVQMCLPMAIGDYTDFYAGKNHAYNIGVLFRGKDNALQPNYVHLPVAYHGRASSVVPSNTPIRRPRAQVLKDPTAPVKTPVFKPCEKLDIELEMGMFICKENKLGEPVSVDDAAESYVFGYVLMNDWSARDVQAWEYVPLGPFTSKNLGTSISSWVVLADAMEGRMTKGLENEEEVQEYLKETREENVLDIDLEVDLITPSGQKTTISKSNSKYLLWSWPQMIAHHTVTGCNLRVGDLFGSGTISGHDEASYGSMLEQTSGGKTTIKLEGGEERKFLQDGDEVVIRGWSVGGKNGDRVGFGEVRGKITPAPTS